jgi:hypothetical protein
VPGTTRALLLDLESTQAARLDEPRPLVTVALVARRDTAEPETSVDLVEEAPRRTPRPSRGASLLVPLEEHMAQAIARLKTWWQSRSAKPKV